MIKCVSQPLALSLLRFELSNPYPKSIPSNPKAGIKIRTPIPAERLELKGLKSLKLLYPLPDSKKERAKMEALGFSVMG